MKFEATPISGLFVVHPERFADSRGYFMETFRRSVFEEKLGPVDFIQDNESESVRGVLRGLHLQTGNDAQAKLVRVAEGAVFDVAVDLRPDSPTFGRWFGTELSHENGRMLFIPAGFAHGFLVLSERARFIYKVDRYYAPQSEVTVRFDDPEIGIAWPRAEGGNILSERDKNHAITFAEYKKLYLA